MWTSEFVQEAIDATRFDRRPHAFAKARDAASALLHRHRIARTLPLDATLIADAITPECWVFTYCSGLTGLRLVRHPGLAAVRYLDRERTKA